MLEQFKLAQEELRLAMAEVAAETAKPAMDEARLPSARLKAVRAGARCKTLVHTYCAMLSNQYPGEAKTLSELQRDTCEIALEISQHVMLWSTRNIAADWPGFTRAFAELHALTLSRIKADAVILYPLLEAHYRQSDAA